MNARDLLIFGIGYACGKDTKKPVGNYWNRNTYDRYSENVCYHCFRTKEEAEHILNATKIILKNVGFVTIDDLADLINSYPGNHTRYRYIDYAFAGWSDLSRATVERSNRGWIINWPPIIR